jgi:hypothetical protein
LSVLLAGCGAGTNHGNGDGGTHDASPSLTLEIAPSNAVLTSVNGSVATQSYTATAHFPDGTSMDVTSLATFSLDLGALGVFSGPTLTANGMLAGATQVRASYHGVSAMVPVTIKVSAVQIVGSAPMNAPDLFGAATEDPSRAPTTVYPTDQTLVPPNLGDFEVHWTDGAGNDLFEVSVTSPFLDLREYVNASGTGWVSFPPDTWAIAGESEKGASVKVVVRGMQSASPATAGSSSPVAVGISGEDIMGGIYYWSPTNQGILRHDFSKPLDPVESFYTSVESGHCVACHALSRDGTKMAITYDGGDQSMTVLDVASRTPYIPINTIYSNFSVFNPDGTKLLTTSHGVLTLRDPSTGMALGTVPTPGYATHPDWSPMGDKIVYVIADNPSGNDWHFTGGHLFVQPVDQTTYTFGAATELVPAMGTTNVYYPTFSPDGNWILFNESQQTGVPSDGDAYSDPSAQIFVVPTDGSLPPALVATANLGPNLTNSWVRWAPFEETTGGETPQPFYWFTFSSFRQFGVRLPGGTRPQIWMAPFFPDRAAAGMDPSLPAFWLPFQDINTNNHIAQWTTTVVPLG